MKTEQKAKAYDEALEQAQKELAACGSINCDAARQIFRLFPQLRESEDERIRNEIIAFIEQAIHSGGGISVPKEKEDRWLAYLEKQKDHFRDDTKMVEQKPAEKETTLNGFEKALDSFLFDFAHSSITDCEPKEYVKNHSAYLLKAAYKELNAQLKQDLFEAQQEGRREGYEAAKNELKPVEWLEEDEVYLQDALWCVNQAAKIARGENDMGACWSAERWLKSLRPQPHIEIYQAAKRDLAIKFMNYLDENRPEGKMSLSNGECEDIDKAFKEGDWAKIIRYIKKYQSHWKPSKEQMEALKCAVDDVAKFSKRGGRQVELENEPYYRALHSLYDNLKKLM